ncbi:hypothetical protein RU92_GL001093 [Lactococcus cremoris subsp. tructae]|uniref:Uncharacterized protein n=2 Tax=Lactococcus lactis subsp. cremoris TaxID=1359 RepID=A0A2A5SQ28_LACLC|nr:hypothetical protein RU92_GL001093 [Lactococcus cremoris subsp. tructae]
MRKTYFIKTFNLNWNLSIFSILGFFLSIVFGVVVSKTESLSKFAPLSKISFYFENIYRLVLMSTFLMILLLLFSVTIENISRLKKDSLTNYFLSIIKTFRLRRFTYQIERTDKVMNDSQSKTTMNPIYHDFNQAVRKSVVDISDNQVLVFIKVPRSQQAQKILKDMEPFLKEEISSQNPDYYFSNPERIKNELWFTGNKR